MRVAGFSGINDNLRTIAFRCACRKTDDTMAARKSLYLLLVSAILLAAMVDARAMEISQPSGKVILTVSGKIENTNRPGAADFDLEMLEALGTETLSTTTSWTDGTQDFRGIPLRKVMSAVGARGKTVEAIALNDYTYEIEIEDFSRFPVILATKLNGRTLKVRDKGPLWIVYPLDDFREPEQIQIERRMVWQLRQLIVK